MIRLIISIALIVVSLATYSQKDKEQQSKIIVTVKGIQNPKGKVYFSIYNEKNFLQKPLETKSAIVKNGIAKIKFTNYAFGIYAVAVYHDKNENEKMDFNAEIGRPAENYGFSNNPILYGPPQFKNVKFELTNKDLTFEILLNDGF